MIIQTMDETGITAVLSSLPPVWLAAGGSACLGVIGALIAAVSRRWFQDRLAIVTLFAAAVLMSVAALHLLPEALAHVRAAPALLALGVLVGLVFDGAARMGAAGRLGGATVATIAPIAAIAVHAFADGVSQASAFAFSPFTGAVTTSGVALHKLPEGAVAFALVYAAGGRALTAFLAAVAVTALTTLIGVAVAQPLLSEFGPTIAPQVFAVAAGLLLYVGASHIAPNVRTAGVAQSTAAFAAGFVVSVVLLTVTGAHSHHAHAQTSMEQAFFPDDG